MGFVDKIIEKAENKIQEIKKKRERKEFIKNFKRHLEKPLDGLRSWISDEMLDLYNVPQEVRYPQREFLIGKLLIRYLKSGEFKGSRIHYIEVVKSNYKEKRNEV